MSSSASRAERMQTGKGLSVPWTTGATAGILTGMRVSTKSSITLPPEELRMVLDLQAKLKAKSKVSRWLLGRADGAEAVQSAAGGGMTVSLAAQVGRTAIEPWHAGVFDEEAAPQ